METKREAIVGIDPEKIVGVRNMIVGVVGTIFVNNYAVADPLGVDPSVDTNPIITHVQTIWTGVVDIVTAAVEAAGIAKFTGDDGGWSEGLSGTGNAGAAIIEGGDFLG